jgi:hypothetical protein
MKGNDFSFFRAGFLRALYQLKIKEFQQLVSDYEESYN